MVATRARSRDLPSQASAPTTLARSPSPSPVDTTASGTVSLRPIKEFVRKLRPEHPLRVLLTGEPDVMSVREYCSKVSGWLRLLPAPGP